jgi:hypothetical protein
MAAGYLLVYPLAVFPSVGERLIIIYFNINPTRTSRKQTRKRLKNLKSWSRRKIAQNPYKQRVKYSRKECLPFLQKFD